MQLIILQPDGTVAVGVMKRMSESVLKDFAKIIKCETVTRFTSNIEELKDYSFWVDDEGLLKEDSILNPIASYCYGANIHGQGIVGCAIIARRDFVDGEETIEELTTKDIKHILGEIAVMQPEIVKLLNKLIRQQKFEEKGEMN